METPMTTAHLSATGLVCCLAALIIQTFPAAAFHAGVDIDASWRVFGFGLFLIAAGALGGRRCSHTAR
jgi:hypothetical protein